MIVILEETFAPPKIAKTGFSPVFITWSIAFTSCSNNFPKAFLFWKKEAMMAVEACALCAVPNASFTYTDPRLDSCFAKSSSP